MKIGKVILLFAFICLLFSSLGSYSQDIQFTQFYSAPLYINPAFAGANVCSRLSTNYRNQWPGIPKAYVTYALSLDHSLPRYNSGVGLLMTNDRAGNGVLRTTSISGLYSYELQLNRKWAIRTGVKATRSARSINYANQIFGDQIARDGAAATIELLPGNKKAYFDVSAGFILYSYRYWLGFAAHHLNTPDQSFLGGNSELPINYSFHGGLKIPVGGLRGVKKGVLKEYITPLLNFRHQNKFNQLDIGCNYTRYPMVFGIWYRGIPLIKSYNPDYINQDAVAFLLGMTMGSLNIGYSYDLTISRLSVSSSGGSHEVSLSYQFCDYKKLKRKKRKPRLLLPCPKF